MDHQIRLAAFDWLKNQTEIHGEVLPRNILEAGFIFKGIRIPLLGPQGIWKPQVMELPLSITSTHDGQYPDAVEGGLLKYSYRGDNPNHPVNVRLRKTMSATEPTPLIYFTKIVPGKYMANWPVYIVNDNPSELTFTAAIDDVNYIGDLPKSNAAEDTEDYSRREYITTKAIRRLHQHAFRERVIKAYRSQCALCKLKTY